MHRRGSEPPGAVRRGLALLVAGCLGTLALLATDVPAASAHDELIASTPAAGATVRSAPQDVELQMSRPAQELGTRVVVSGPDGAPVSEGGPQLDGASVVQPLAAGLPSGRYTVEWQVTSSDGHPLSGTFSFTVATADPESGAGGAVAAPSDDPTAGPSDPAGPEVEEAAAAAPAGSAGTGWIALGAVLVLAVAAALGFRHLRRRS